MSSLFYTRASDFFEAEGDFQENLEADPDHYVDRDDDFSDAFAPADV